MINQLTYWSGFVRFPEMATMATSSRIEWTDTTWNPVSGCRKVSEGCRNCYAERMSKRLAAMARADVRAKVDPGRKRNYLKVINQNGRWNGDVFMDETALDIPFHWRQPRTVFVNSMSDLFHEDVTLAFIRRVFETMAQCPQHIFQVLTKRPERAAELGPKLDWPDNVWMGTSVEDDHVRYRIGLLAKVPAKVRFLSVEPLIGRIRNIPLRGIHWVIVGGESGPGARPMEEEWVLEIRDRCQEKQIPFFFKQWGGINKKIAGRNLRGRTWNELPQGVVAHVA